MGLGIQSDRTIKYSQINKSLAMTDQKQSRTFVTEEILEVRYVPKGSFLTQAGDIADYVCDKGLFPHWEVDSNIVKFRDVAGAPKNLHAFVSYKNAGIVAIDSQTSNFFQDKATQYWRAIESNKFFQIPTIQRIGVRHKFFVKIEKSFEEIEGAMFDYLCKPSVLKALDGNRKDLQVVIDIETKLGKLRAVFGPLTKGEANQFFPFQSPHFSSAGVFIDLDLFIESPKPDKKVVENFIRSACEANWSRVDKLLVEMGV